MSGKAKGAADMAAWAREWVAGMLDGLVIVAEDETLEAGGTPELAARRCEAIRALVAEMRRPPAAQPAPPSPNGAAGHFVCGRCDSRIEWMLAEPSGESVLRCLGCGDTLRVRRVAA